MVLIIVWVICIVAGIVLMAWISPKNIITGKKTGKPMYSYKQEAFDILASIVMVVCFILALLIAWGTLAEFLDNRLPEKVAKFIFEDATEEYAMLTLVIVFAIHAGYFSFLRALSMELQRRTFGKKYDAYMFRKRHKRHQSKTAEKAAVACGIDSDLTNVRILPNGYLRASNDDGSKIRIYRR